MNRLLFTKALKTLLPLLCWLACQPAQAAEALPLETLNRQALQASPQLQACQAELQARQAELQAAGLWQNPRLEIDGEDFLGSAAALDYHQWTLSLSQTLPWLPRQDATRRALAAGLQIQQQVCAEQALALQLRLGEHYLAALAAREQALQWQQQEALARELLQRSERLLAMGKITRLAHQAPLQVLAGIQGARADAEAALASQLQLLQSYLPPQTLLSPERLQMPSAETLSERFERSDLPRLQAQLQIHPRVQQAQLAVAEAEAWLALEKEQPWPDLGLGSGLRWHPPSQTLGLNLRLGADLPVYHQNQTGVAAAQARLQQARQALTYVIGQQLREALALQQEGLRLQRQLRQLQEALLPLAEAEVQALEKGWLSGSQNYTALNWLQARLRLQNLQQEQQRVQASYRLLALQLQLLGLRPATP